MFTYEFQNIVIMLMSIIEEKNTTYNRALNQIERVIKLIDEELMGK